MSRRQSNTLLNYFQSPKVVKKAEIAAKQDSSDEEKEIIAPKKRTRIQVVTDSSDSDTESPKPTIKKRRSPDSNSENENFTPNKPRTSKKTESDNGTPSKRKSITDFKFQTEKSLDTSNSSKSVKPETRSEIISDIHSNWRHNKLEFLKPDKIMDANKRTPDHPDYDPKTLYVPESYLKELTPAMRQWWELKSQHMDTVLFFKVGKFYELYHMDAVVGVIQLGFSYMKGDFAHSGFPETAYGKMANMLIERGYKVARCEQTETPEMMENRCKSMKKPTKFDKVVRREICQVSSKGSTIYTAQLSEPQTELPYYMYAISTKPLLGGSITVGVCFVETSLGTFFLSQFTDDKHFSKLLALFAEFPAALILTERGHSSQVLSGILKTCFRDTRNDSLLSKNQFLTASDTLEKLAAACYFRDKEGKFQWPEFFKEVADDCLPKKHCELALSSLGACLWHLKKSEMDIQVFSMGKFQWYDPLIVPNTKKVDKDYMILDAVTISNLNLLGSLGSLQKVLDHCSTPFGKRLLHRWICRPLCNVKKIRDRQKAINELLNNPDTLKNAQNLLKTMPDLERQLTKIHIYGNRFIAKNHPDSRAILYEQVTYSKRKIRDFIKTLQAFERLQNIPDIFKDCEDWLLKKITQFEPDGVNIDLNEVLNHMKNAFDLEKVEKEGKIIPTRGIIDDFDKVEMAIENIQEELDEYLAEQSKFFGCKLKYFGSDKKRFQIEVPARKADRATSEYHLESARKGADGVKRYSTSRTRELLAAMIRTETERAKVILDLNRRMFETFSERNEQFSQVTECIAMLDVLCSLADYARTCSHDICIPEIVSFSDKPYIIIENGYHPCITNVDNFVPNDITLGLNSPHLLILTGPNMGGKSTLMRQVVTIAIMAQLGSFVPASKCQLSLVDRVFTRLGARDDIIQGQSTFYVELSEAVSILKHSTQDSLVLIDELGRGTSTHDGNAIATAYLNKLTTVGCRVMFSTHYHSLVDNFTGRNDIQLGHMACMAENDDDPTQESVIFLYKLVEGRCPKSYGFNAARLAGMDRRIVNKAIEMAGNLEKVVNRRDVFRAIYTTQSVSDLRSILSTLKI